MSDQLTPIVDPEFCALIPPLSDAERDGLEADIIASGCRDPLVLWRGVLLDGHNRLSICERHGIAYTTTTVELPDRDAAKDWMLRNQLHRRNLTREQFTVLIGRRYLLQKQRHGGQVRGMGQNDPSLDRTSERIAAEHGVKERTVRRAADVVAALPDVSPAEQAQLLAAAKQIKRDRRKQRDQERAEQRAAVLATDHPLSGERYKLFVHDVRDGCPLVPEPQVIITDPPYPEEYVGLYSCLVRTAQEALPDGGSLLAMAGQSHLPQILHTLGGHLSYQWTLNYYTPGQSTQIFGRHVKSNWKPVLWYVKGSYTGEHVDDTIRSGENDKRFHDWGQSVSGMAALIERFTVPGDLVYDPFCGGGSTGVAALLTGRLFIGSDIDEACVRQTAARLAEVAP